MKSELRTLLRTRLSGLSAVDRLGFSAAICDHLLHSPLWKAAVRVALFHPLPSEPDFTALWERNRGKEYFLPRITAAGLDFCRVNSLEELVPGPLGVREPPPSAERCNIELIDLFLVPGLGFTKVGDRLGRGGGYYDRAIGHRFCEKSVGVCFDQQIVSNIPIEPHDFKVGTLLTESGLVRMDQAGSHEHLQPG
jgi:5-formyltetrahydrofolate cyclo-ligase